MRKTICELVEQVASAEQRNIVIYGANEVAEIVAIVLREYSLNMLGIVDNEKAGEFMLGMMISPSSFLIENKFDAIIINSTFGIGFKRPPICSLTSQHTARLC
jgi:hypothetical protein